MSRQYYQASWFKYYIVRFALYQGLCQNPCIVLYYFFSSKLHNNHLNNINISASNLCSSQEFAFTELFKQKVYINLSLLPPLQRVLGQHSLWPLAPANDDTSWGLFVTAACRSRSPRPGPEPPGWGHCPPVLIFSLTLLCSRLGGSSRRRGGREQSQSRRRESCSWLLQPRSGLPSGLAPPWPQPLTSGPGHWLGLSQWLLILYFLLDPIFSFTFICF